MQPISVQYTLTYHCCSISFSIIQRVYFYSKATLDCLCLDAHVICVSWLTRPSWIYHPTDASLHCLGSQADTASATEGSIITPALVTRYVQVNCASKPRKTSPHPGSSKPAWQARKPRRWKAPRPEQQPLLGPAWLRSACLGPFINPNPLHWNQNQKHALDIQLRDLYFLPTWKSVLGKVKQLRVQAPKFGIWRHYDKNDWDSEPKI